VNKFWPLVSVKWIPKFTLHSKILEFFIGGQILSLSYTCRKKPSNISEPQNLAASVIIEVELFQSLNENRLKMVLKKYHVNEKPWWNIVNDYVN
jgi:hypothetical protein